MNKNYLSALLAAAALAFTACSSNDDNIVDNTADAPVAAQITAGISNGQTVTRISTTDEGSAFAEGDVIHVVANGAVAYDYTLQGSAWAPVTDPYYFQDRDDVAFQGWYAAIDATDNSIGINTTEQTINGDGWNEWDILVTPTVTTSVSSPTVNFTGDNAFAHIMTQVTLAFTAGDGIDDLTALSQYTLKSLTTGATFDAQSCTLTAGSDIADIAQDVTGATGTEYTCTPIILVPQDIADGTIVLEVTYNSQTYTADLTLPSDATALADGTHYTFNVTINNTGLKVDGAEIANWATTDTQSSDATMR